jgi:hypothetical protein
MYSISDAYLLRITTMKHLPFLILLLVPIVLIGCAPPPTQAEAQATAVVAGCWPGNVATPRAVTVTPDPLLTTPTLTATVTTGTGTPTATPWPTATRAATTTPYPTQEPKLRQGGSDMQTTLQLPGHTYRLKIAVHPTEGWPVVGIMQRFSESADPIQSFVRVFNPRSNKWGPAQQVDIGDSSNGQDRFGSTVVGVTGDGAVHVVYGASDMDFSDGDPPTYLWTRSSTDYGATWSPPRRIARDCWVADDMATTALGWIVVAANCYIPHGLGEVTPQPVMIVRRPDGTWLDPERIPMPNWYGAEGAVVIVGDGDQARAIALRFGNLGAANGKAYLISKRLADGGDWQVAERDITVPYGGTGERDWHASGLVFPQTRPDGSTTSGVIFTWTGTATTGAYALTSLDGGQSWGMVEPIVYDARDPLHGGIHVAWVAPAYDPAASRLLAIWTCCGDATFASEESTHYASWRVPGSGVWSPGRVPGRSEPLIPVVLGSRSAWNSVATHSINARSVWVGWVEQGNQINVRTLNLNQIIPVDVYPTPTLRPSATPATGGTP